MLSIRKKLQHAFSGNQNKNPQEQNVRADFN